ncbi:MAG: hypothetical protein HUU25_08025 [Candidatus Sumerlaeia bacterium]|nr:hypothetical protein [Candidatus Sumerlaeia bacterium]
MTLAQAAALVDGRIGAGDPGLSIRAVAPLVSAPPGSIAAVIGKSAVLRLAKSRAAALLVTEVMAGTAGDRPHIIVDRPGDAARLLEKHLRTRA